MSEFEIDYHIEINNEQDAETVLAAFKDMDRVLSSLERRRHNHNFAKKIEKYEAKISEDIEKIKKLNLPKEEYNERVKGISDYYMLVSRATPLGQIGVAERELNLLIYYLSGIRKAWPIYKRYLIDKYCGDIDIPEQKD